MTPEELGVLADDFEMVYQKRLAADKVAAELKTAESQLKAALIREMTDSKLSAVGGRKVRLTIEKIEIPTAQDWEKVWAHIRETGDFSLLEKRLGKAAVKERWENGEEVPGVIHFPDFKLHRSTAGL